MYKSSESLLLLSLMSLRYSDSESLSGAVGYWKMYTKVLTQLIALAII